MGLDVTAASRVDVIAPNASKSSPLFHNDEIMAVIATNQIHSHANPWKISVLEHKTAWCARYTRLTGNPGADDHNSGLCIVLIAHRRLAEFLRQDHGWIENG